jgi:hypothetical protein
VIPEYDGLHTACVPVSIAALTGEPFPRVHSLLCHVSTLYDGEQHGTPIEEVALILQILGYDPLATIRGAWLSDIAPKLSGRRGVLMYSMGFGYSGHAVAWLGDGTVFDPCGRSIRPTDALVTGNPVWVLGFVEIPSYAF